MARAGPPAATTRAAAPSAVSEHCAGHCGESRAPSGDHARRRRRFACRANTGPANHNGTSAQTHFANILLAAFTLRLRTGKNQYYGNHNGSSAQTQCTQRDTQLLCSIYKAIRLPRKHWSCKSQWHQCTDTLRKHPSRSIYTATPNRQEPILWKSQWQ